MQTQNAKSKHAKLPFWLRVVIGIASIPSFLLAGMLGSMLMNGNSADIGFFEVLYAVVGIIGLYIALTGKRFF